MVSSNVTNWYDLLQNPDAIKELYDLVPDLSGVELMSLLLSREGPHVTLVIESERYPDRPPERWHREANRVSVTLSFWGIEDFVAKGLYSEMKVHIDISLGSSGTLNVVILNPATEEAMSFAAQFYRIDRINSYISDSK